MMGEYEASPVMSLEVTNNTKNSFGMSIQVKPLDGDSVEPSIAALNFTPMAWQHGDGDDGGGGAAPAAKIFEVANLGPTGLAARAGVKVGDVLFEVDGFKFTEETALFARLSNIPNAARVRFTVLGLFLGDQGGKVVVTKVRPGYAAQHSIAARTVSAGDVVVAVNGTLVAGQKRDHVYRLIGGTRGDTVKLTVSRSTTGPQASHSRIEPVAAMPAVVEPPPMPASEPAIAGPTRANAAAPNVRNAGEISAFDLGGCYLAFGFCLCFPVLGVTVCHNPKSDDHFHACWYFGQFGVGFPLLSGHWQRSHGNTWLAYQGCPDGNPGNLDPFGGKLEVDIYPRASGPADRTICATGYCFNGCVVPCPCDRNRGRWSEYGHRIRNTADGGIGGASQAVQRDERRNTGANATGQLTGQARAEMLENLSYDERGVWSHNLVLAPSTRNIPTFNFMGEQSYGNQGEEVLRRAQEESLRHDEENTLRRAQEESLRLHLEATNQYL